MLLSLILKNNFVNCTPTESSTALVDYVNDENKNFSLKITPINSGKQIEISLANNNEGCRFFPMSIKIIALNDVNKLNNSKLRHLKTLHLSGTDSEEGSVNKLGFNYNKLAESINSCQVDLLAVTFHDIFDLYNDHILNQDKEIVRYSAEKYIASKDMSLASEELYNQCRKSAKISAVLKINDFNKKYGLLDNTKLQQQHTFINRLYAFLYFYPVIKINSEALMSELTPLGQDKVASGTIFRIELRVEIYDASKIVGLTNKLLKNPEIRCTKLLQVLSANGDIIITEFTPTVVNENRFIYWIKPGIFIGVCLIVIILLFIIYKFIRKEDEPHQVMP